MITYNCMPAARQWDGHSYDRISGPMEALGREVLGRLELRGEETVIDAGCGSGRITQAPRRPEQPREFLQGIVLGPHVQHLPEDLRARFMDDVLDELGEPVVVDYVRLNIDATA